LLWWSGVGLCVTTARPRLFARLKPPPGVAVYSAYRQIAVSRRRVMCSKEGPFRAHFRQCPTASRKVQSRAGAGLASGETVEMDD